MKLRRVVVISDDAVESGGAAGVALQSVRLLAERGIPVTVLNGSAPNGDLGSRPGIDLHSLGARNILQGSRGSAALRGVFNRDAERFVADWIGAHDEPGTVYHLHNWHKVLSPAVFRALSGVADRLVLTAHDYFLVCPTGGQFDFAAGRRCERTPMSLACLTTQCDRRHYGHKLWRVGRHLARTAFFDLARTASTVVVVHDGMIPYLTRGGVAAGAIAVLRNPVVPWRRERVVAEGNGEVLFVGRLEEDKGVDLVASAAAAIGARLRIVGDGPLRAKLERDHPRAILTGWRTPREIAEYAAAARFAVVPTRWRETFGLVTLEAVMSGLPVLVSNHALIAPELVELGCAAACDPYDGAALAAGMRRLSEDPELVHGMSVAGFTRARALAPTPEAWCDDLIALYRAKLAVWPSGRPSGWRGAYAPSRWTPAIRSRL